MKKNKVEFEKFLEELFGCKVKALELDSDEKDEPSSKDNDVFDDILEELLSDAKDRIRSLAKSMREVMNLLIEEGFTREEAFQIMLVCQQKGE